MIAFVTFANNSTGNRQFWCERNNGGTPIGGAARIFFQANPASATQALNPTFTGIIDLVAGDTLQFVCSQNSGGDLNINGAASTGVWISIMRLSE